MTSEREQMMIDAIRRLCDAVDELAEMAPSARARGDVLEVRALLVDLERGFGQP